MSFVATFQYRSSSSAHMILVSTEQRARDGNEGTDVGQCLPTAHPAAPCADSSCALQNPISQNRFPRVRIKVQRLHLWWVHWGGGRTLSLFMNACRHDSIDESVEIDSGGGERCRVRLKGKLCNPESNGRE